MREKRLKIWLTHKFKMIISNKNYSTNAMFEINQVIGAISYMNLVEDIDDETYNKLIKLCYTLKKKINERNIYNR